VGDTVVEQELIYEKLPGDIAKRHVLLMDPILATGNSAARAIQVRRLKPAAVQILAVAVHSLSAEIGPCSLPRIAGVLCPELAPNCCVCCSLDMLPIAANGDVGNELQRHCIINCSFDYCHTFIFNP
jgi:hypothetical protein